MPTLVRFLLILGLLAAVVYGVMFALVAYVDPEPREITVTVPPSKLGK